MLVEECFAGDNKSGSAKSTLRGVVVDERLLDGMQLAASHERFDGGDLLALSFDCEYRTRVRGFIVDQHGARSAFAAVAHSFGAGQIQIVAKSIEQRDARLDFQLRALAI